MSNPSTGRLVGGLILLYCSCFISSAGGIGGGGLNLPILLVVVGYNYTDATILSLCTVLGNVLSQFYINWNKPHPHDASRPLIYWDTVLVLLPAQLGGANIGVILAKILPETVLLILAMVVLIYAVVKTFIKGYALYNKESASMNYLKDSYKLNEEIRNPTNISIDPELSLKLSNDVNVNQSLQPISSAKSSIEILPKIEITYPTNIMIALGGIWIIYAAMYVTNQVAATTCSPTYFAIFSCLYPPIIVTIYWAIHVISIRQKENPLSVLEGDINFSKVTFIPPTLSFFIGIICTLLGIGGGELLGPLLLQLSVISQVSSATTSIMSLLNSSSTVLHYIILGEINYPIAAAVFATGLVGGFSGRIFAIYISMKYQRNSFFILALVTVLFISFWMLVYYVVVDSPDLELHSFC